MTDPIEPGLIGEQSFATFDAARFRQVLGHFPTGVTVVAAQPEGRPPVGLAVGSFASVSLEPPLVAFFPDRGSSSWPLIREAGAFCVNVLGADQEDVCRVFASKGTDKFEGIGWHPSSTGSPIIADVVAWIDCRIEAVHEAGDHFVVLGRVVDLGVGRDGEGGPLVFYRGGYGRFSS